MYDTKDDIGAIKDRVRAKMLKDPRIAIRQLCMRDFYYFLRHFWPVVSSDPFQGNWHIELVCRELQELAERVGERLPALYDLLINVPPGSTKPFWEQTPVQMADGSWKLLKDVVVGDRVINRHGVGCDVTGVHIQGELPCVVIRTFGGRSLVCAEDHPILTADGWVNAGDIEVGQMLALMHSPKIEATSERSIDEFKLAGYFVGDGSVANNSCQLDGITPEYLDDFIECASNLGFDHYSRVQKNGVTTISLKSKKQEKRTGQFKGMGRGYRESTGPRKWLKDVGLAGKDSRTKEVPEFVFKGTDEQVAAFLSAYFHCDGCVSFKDSGKRSIVVSVTTVSKKLALGLQRLFLRLGISMRVRRRVAKNGFGYNRSLKNYIYFTVDTTDQDTAVRFLERIPISGPKERKLRKFKPQRRTFHQQYWPDRVSSIELLSEKKKCRCLSVSDGESFVADGVVVHNTVSCSIMFPAWCWTRWFWMRFITVSYSAVLSLESAEFSRDLIRSAEFREIFPELEIKVDKDTKSNFRVQRVEKGRKILGGNRFSTSVGGTLTGFHGHILIVDDPLNPQQAASDNELRACNQWMSQTLPTRKTDKAVTPMLLIQQRLHQNDPTGYRLEHAPHSVRHICLPGEIKNYRAQVQPPELAANYSEDGLLDPVRLSWPVLNKLKEDLGQYGFSGQVGQFPVPPGGGMFQVDRFVLVDSVEHLLRDPNNILGVVRFWDKASTEDGGDWTVGVKMYQLARPDGGYWFLITDVRRGQWASHVRESIIRSVAEADGVGVPVFMEQEPGSGGKDSAQATIRNLAGFVSHAERSTGDKVFRADPYSVQVNNGNVMLLQADWTHPFIEEHRFFPFSTYDDQVDGASGAFSKLAGAKVVQPW
ncbi:MAG: phage terminase large subunit [Dehalococcoidales bacterium]